MQIKRIPAIFLFLLTTSFLSAQTVGVVLSGGGAKGISHVGVIKALEENNIPIDYIAGTSMGAIVAALYSIGVTPDEMLALFRSSEFNSWFKGEFEKGYATYIYRGEPTAEMVGISLTRKKKNRIGIRYPVSLISPFPMDLAVKQLFSSPAAAASYNFDNFMIPFRCVAADIVSKKPLVLKEGDLSSAIRASMTYPFLFKPITIDSTLLFDGGLYNNFPWDVMVRDFNPDIIIGSKCSGNAGEPDTEDIVSQLENMLRVETDYTVPEGKGILLDIQLPGVSIIDFNKADEICKIGYSTAESYMAGIKRMIKRRINDEEITNKRLDFRKKVLPLKFANVKVSGNNLSKNQEEFIINTIKNNSDEPFSFEQFKRGFYRVVATGNVASMYPDICMREDSLFNINLRVHKSDPLRLSIGGNISSSSLNQGYLGLQYNTFSKNPLKATADANIGRFYSGLNLLFRQDIGIKPLIFYEAQFTAHIFDYFTGGQTTFYSDRVPGNIQESEVFVTLSAGTPVNIDKSILARINLYAGSNFYEYYQTDNYTTYDIPDRTRFGYISPSLILERNTTNYKLYPTEGKREKISLRFAYISETYTPGSTSPTRTEIKRNNHTSFYGRAGGEYFLELNRYFTLGLLVDLALSNRTYMGDHISTLLYLPAFLPNPHSKTLLLNGYRAPSFLGVAVTPIVKFTDSFSLHIQGAFFQPNRQLIENTEGEARFTDLFPKGSFLGNIAVVWQSPVGPISLSASYYQRSPVKWFPQLNIGFLIFKSKALVY